MELAETQYAQTIYTFYQDNTIKKCPHSIADTHLQFIGLSPETWMLRFAGYLSRMGHLTSMRDSFHLCIHFGGRVTARARRIALGTVIRSDDAYTRMAKHKITTVMVNVVTLNPEWPMTGENKIEAERYPPDRVGGAKAKHESRDGTSRGRKTRTARSKADCTRVESPETANTAALGGHQQGRLPERGGAYGRIRERARSRCDRRDDRRQGGAACGVEGREIGRCIHNFLTIFSLTAIWSTSRTTRPTGNHRKAG